jgi:hypothetical protein
MCEIVGRRQARQAVAVRFCFNFLNLQSPQQIFRSLSLPSAAENNKDQTGEVDRDKKGKFHEGV